MKGFCVLYQDGACFVTYAMSIEIAGEAFPDANITGIQDMNERLIRWNM